MTKPRIAWRQDHDVSNLYLGKIYVGQVWPREGGFLWDFELGREYWQKSLTAFDARAAVEAALADWLKRAGLGD